MVWVHRLFFPPLSTRALGDVCSPDEHRFQSDHCFDKLSCLAVFFKSFFTIIKDGGFRRWSYILLGQFRCRGTARREGSEFSDVQEEVQRIY